MTSVIINDVLPYTQATAVGAQTVYSTNWTADSADDVYVYSRIAGSSPDDAADILASSAYNVAFIGAEEIVEVTLNTPSTAGDIVTIVRNTPVDRENLYTNINFTPSMLNQDFGLVTLQIQENDMSERVRTPRYPNSAFIQGFDLILPILAANQSWVMSPDGDEILAQVISGGGGGDVTFAILASHAAGEGASLIGLNPTGTVEDLSNAAFIVKTPSGVTPNAQALSTLSTGILKSTTTTGVLSISLGLTSIDGLITGADMMIYTTALNTYAVTALTPVARTLLAQTTFAGMAAVLGALSTSGGTMSGDIDMGNNSIINLANPVSAQDAATKFYVDDQVNDYLPLAGGTMVLNTAVINMNSGKITNLDDPTNAQDAATKNYVDLVAVGLAVQPAVRLATTGALTATYANGASGIGATLTNAGALAALSLDSEATATNDRVLIKDQADPIENGIYDVTNIGSGVVAWVLTRATDYDQPSEISPGDLIVVNEGATYEGTSFIETASVSAVGTDPIEFSQFTFSATAVLLKANNLSDVANTTTSFNNISPTTTKGDLIVDDGTNDVRLAVGTVDGQLLQVKAATATGLVYTTATYPETTTVNQLLYSSATNTVVGLATANSALLVTDQLGVPSWLGSLTNGQLVIGSTGAIPVIGTISAGSGINVAVGAGTITVSTTGGVASWSEIAGTSQAAVVNTGYVVGNAAQTTITLPAVAAVGSIVSVQGKGAGGWILAANAGQTIIIGSTATGVAGSLTSTNLNDSIEVVCITANTTWSTRFTLSTGLTVV